MAYRLSAGSKPLATQIQEIFAEELASASAKLEGGSEGDRDSRIHQARKCIKRARATLRLVQDQLGARMFGRNNKQLRSVAQSISRLRDAQVVLETFDAICDDAAIRKILEAQKLAVEQDDLGGSLLWAQGKLDGLQHSLDELKLEGNGLMPLNAGVVSFYRQGRKAMVRAHDHPSAVRLHDWRKRVKDHWYHMRLLAGVELGALASREADLRKLESLLGDGHNLHVLRGVLKPIEQAASLLPLIEARETDLQNQAFELGQRLYETKPKAFRLLLRKTLAQGPAVRKPIRAKAEALRPQVVA